MKYLYIGVSLILLVFADFFFLCWGLSEVWGPSYDLWWGFPVSLTLIILMAIAFVFGGINIENWISQRRPS